MQHNLHIAPDKSKPDLTADVRLLTYLPSTLASAAMLYIVKEVEPFDSETFQDLLTCFLKTNKVCIHIKLNSFFLKSVPLPILTL